MNNLINLNVGKREAISLIRRFGGVSFFSEKSEEEAIKILKEKNKNKFFVWEIVGLLVIIGIKNMDVFDINSLSEAAASSPKEIFNIFNKGLMEEYFPLKINKNEVKKNKESLDKEMKKLKNSNEEFAKRKMRFIREFIRIFNKWREEGRIILY